MLVLITVASALIAAVVHYVRTQNREEIIEVYGSTDVYRLLASSQDYEAWQVHQVTLPKSAGIAQNFLDAISIARCEKLPARTASRMHELLTSPEHFKVDFAKSYLFTPTILLRSRIGERQIDIYICFRSGMAAILVDAELARTLAFDKVSDELSKLLVSVCSDHSATNE
jgi:hypothetical protein